MARRTEAWLAATPSAVSSPQILRWPQADHCSACLAWASTVRSVMNRRLGIASFRVPVRPGQAFPLMLGQLGEQLLHLPNAHLAGSLKEFVMIADSGGSRITELSCRGAVLVCG